VIDEPLFPRYLFIQLERGKSAMGWGPIRSTRGVSRLVTFGNEPARVDDGLIEVLRQTERAYREAPRPLYNPGDRLRITQGPFAGVDAIFEMSDGLGRVLVLIEFLSKPVRMSIEPVSLRKTS